MNVNCNVCLMCICWWVVNVLIEEYVLVIENELMFMIEWANMKW